MERQTIFKAIMVREDVQDEFNSLRDHEGLKNSDMLEKLIMFYQANKED